MRQKRTLLDVVRTNVRERRLDMGATQRELGEAIGLSSWSAGPRISDMERKGRGLTLSNIAKLAKALDCKPYELLMVYRGGR